MLILGIRIFNQILLGSLKKSPVRIPYTVNFRCTPFDIDLYMHQNNAMYVRIAELTRWRLLAEGNVFSFAKKRGLQFFAADQSVRYYKQIQLFKKYSVSTTISITDNKWMHFHHVFHTHEDELKGDEKPVTFTVVTCKAVMKDRVGKTIPPMDLINSSDIFKSLVKEHSSEIVK